jgi:hypothetical protein
VVPLSCFIDLPYITHPQAAKQAANFEIFISPHLLEEENTLEHYVGFDYAQKQGFIIKIAKNQEKSHEQSAICTH